jgi:hypothetical protein
MADDAEAKVQEGIEHLQAAAREVIHATRSLLDAAESLLDDPTSVQDLVGSLAHVVQAAAGHLAGGGTTTGADEGDRGPVQRIKVS